jgi:hypothetical protein
MEEVNLKSTRDRLVLTVMKRKYEKSGVTLPEKYWNLPEYKKDYQHQIRAAAKLLKAFSIEAITAALEKENWCWSLHSPVLQDKIELEQSRLEKNRIAIRQKEQDNTYKQLDNKPLFRKKTCGKEKN